MIPKKAIQRMRHLNYDYNSPRHMVLDDSSGRMVCKVDRASENWYDDMDALIEIVRWAAAEYERGEMR